jgi:hypothetical protein
MNARKKLGWGLMLAGAALMVAGEVAPGVLAGILLYAGALVMVGIGMAVAFA